MLGSKSSRKSRKPVRALRALEMSDGRNMNVSGFNRATSRRYREAGFSTS